MYDGKSDAVFLKTFDFFINYSEIMDAVRKNYLALGLLAVNDKHNGGGYPKFYVTITHKYSCKYYTDDYPDLRSFTGKIMKSELIYFPCSTYVHYYYIALFRLLAVSP